MNVAKVTKRRAPPAEPRPTALGLFRKHQTLQQEIRDHNEAVLRAQKAAAAARKVTLKKQKGPKAGIPRVRKSALKVTLPKAAQKNRPKQRAAPKAAPTADKESLSPSQAPRVRGWIRKWSADHDAYYWYNWDTDKSHWERPGNPRIELLDIFGVTVKAYNGQGRMSRTSPRDDHPRRPNLLLGKPSGEPVALTQDLNNIGFDEFLYRAHSAHLAFWRAGR